ncbi:unnamed protein product [Trichogramma brassicae]|uniref:DUF5641 domain-containing protein n=1 Tax=Trichogramma brassicae TaxID=86971 RepID=A0A6H5J4C0_9HYME|nr:unnamed protein product [Trichogramma brassicae]
MARITLRHTAQDLRIHAFADASRRAMAAVTYSRCEDETGQVRLRILVAKNEARTHPQRPGGSSENEPAINHPKAGATSCAHRPPGSCVRPATSWPLTSTRAWPGRTQGSSSTGLTQPRRSAILWSMDTSIKSKNWTLRSIWRAPSGWLKEPPHTWPPNRPPDCEEQRLCLYVAAEDEDVTDWLRKFSSLTRALRFMVRLKLWIRQRWNRDPCPDPLQPMTAQELGEAFEACLVRSQLQYFEVEARELRHSRPVPRKSPLAALDPFLDAKESSGWTAGCITPRCRFHLKTPTYFRWLKPSRNSRHRLGSCEIDPWRIQGHLRPGFQRAWLINGEEADPTPREPVRDMCSRPSANNEPYHGSAASEPCHSCPAIRTHWGRLRRSIFLCARVEAKEFRQVKPGHSPRASWQFEDGQLAGRTHKIRRPTTSTKGNVERPNATNFHRADFEIRAAMKSEQIRWPRLADYLPEEGIEWKFIPPSAPHFGGLWEAAVRSYKFHLKRAVGTQHVTYEELNTLIIGVEAVLNSRPLEPVTGDPDDLCVLTPSSESTGMSLLILPDKEPSETPLDKLQNWKLVEGLRADFWSKWSRTYLNTLQQRHKWQRRRASINVGDIVLIVDPSLLLPCGRWPLGCVTHTYPGADGQVRVAQVQTASGSNKRPVVKLVSLPVRTNPPDPASPIPAHAHARTGVV